jgi:hypothetical protein
MIGLEFDRHEVDNLARKLDSLGKLLTESERRLLLAIFSAARDHVAVLRPTEEPEPTDLGDQILRAFIPAGGNEAGFIITQGIGHDPM